MRPAEATMGALLVGALAMICCAGPPLVAAVGTTALAVWVSKSAFVLVAAALVAAGVGAACLYRRRLDAQDCCPPKMSRRASDHEHE